MKYVGCFLVAIAFAVPASAQDPWTGQQSPGDQIRQQVTAAAPRPTAQTGVRTIAIRVVGFKDPARTREFFRGVLEKLSGGRYREVLDPRDERAILEQNDYPAMEVREPDEVWEVRFDAHNDGRPEDEQLLNETQLVVADEAQRRIDDQADRRDNGGIRGALGRIGAEAGKAEIRKRLGNPVWEKTYHFWIRLSRISPEGYLYTLGESEAHVRYRITYFYRGNYNGRPVRYEVRFAGGIDPSLINYDNNTIMEQNWSDDTGFILAIDALTNRTTISGSAGR